MNAMFWFTAGVLTGVTATAVALPFWRGIGKMIASRPRTHLIGAGGIAVFACSAALFYLAIGASPSPQQRDSIPDRAGAETGARAPAPSMEEATARLQARLERDGGTPDDWELLAKSYEFLGRPADATRAREHVGAATAPADPGSTAGSTQNASLGSALTAYEKLTSSTAPAVASAAEISGTVSIESRLAGRVDGDATLFIYAKAADSPGPPLAVLRLTTKQWPVNFRLDDSLAMLPSRRLSQFQKVIVEARISRSGQAAPASGDLYVTSDILSPSAGKKLALVINHEIG